jgi:hypothetical protein
MWSERIKLQEKEAKIEAFSNLCNIKTYLECIKEIAEVEMCKFELWELYQGEVAAILQMDAFKMDD